MLRALTVVIVLILLGDAAGLAVTRDDERVTATSSTSVVTTTTDGAPSGIESVVPELQRFVEKERGLQFRSPVKVELLADDAFVKRLRGADERDQEALQKAEAFLAAFNLIDKDVDLDKALDELLGSAVAGFYDPKTKALVVRGGEATPYVRSILAHELTHALQDQRFDLDRPELDRRSDEAGQAFTGLAEGDAVRIQIQYFRSLPRAQQRDFLAEQEKDQGPPDDVPEVLVNVLTFPYQVGPEFVQALLRDGGQARLDAAFSAPPETSEDLIYPEVFLDGEKAKPVETPTAEAAVRDEGVFGAFGLILLLGEDLGARTASRVAQGWGGDHYVAWRAGNEDCVRTNFVMDTQRDTDELVSALQRWAGKHPGATVSGSGSGPVVFTSCG